MRRPPRILFGVWPLLIVVGGVAAYGAFIKSLPEKARTRYGMAPNNRGRAGSFRINKFEPEPAEMAVQVHSEAIPSAVPPEMQAMVHAGIWAEVRFSRNGVTVKPSSQLAHFTLQDDEGALWPVTRKIVDHRVLVMIPKGNHASPKSLNLIVSIDGELRGEFKMPVPPASPRILNGTPSTGERAWMDYSRPSTPMLQIEPAAGGNPRIVRVLATSFERVNDGLHEVQQGRPVRIAIDKYPRAIDMVELEITDLVKKRYRERVSIDGVVLRNHLDQPYLDVKHRFAYRFGEDAVFQIEPNPHPNGRRPEEDYMPQLFASLTHTIGVSAGELRPTGKIKVLGPDLRDRGVSLVIWNPYLEVENLPSMSPTGSFQEGPIPPIEMEVDATVYKRAKPRRVLVRVENEPPKHHLGL